MRVVVTGASRGIGRELVTQLVARGTAKKLVHITSSMGSITDNTSGGYYPVGRSEGFLSS